MIATFTIAVLAVLAVAIPANAAPSIVTPALRPPSGGSLQCLVANASDKTTVEYTAKIYSFDGTVKANSSTALEPNKNLALIAGAITQGHCKIEVAKGGKRNLRVSLQVLDAGGTVLAAVPGQ